MQGGDIDNTPVPRVYVVFEGTIAQLDKTRRFRRPRLEDHVVDVDVSRGMWDLWQRYSVRFDAVTFNFDPVKVEAWLDERVPITTVWGFESREFFVAQIPFMPWLSSVVDHARPMAYGAKGTSLAGMYR